MHQGSFSLKPVTQNRNTIRHREWMASKRCDLVWVSDSACPSWQRLSLEEQKAIHKRNNDRKRQWVHLELISRLRCGFMFFSNTRLPDTPRCTLEHSVCGVPAGTLVSQTCSSQLLHLAGVVQLWLDTHDLQALWCSVTHSGLSDITQQSYLDDIAKHTMTTLSLGTLVNYQGLCATVQHIQAAQKMGQALLPLFDDISVTLEASLKIFILSERTKLRELLLLVQSAHHVSQALIKAWHSVPSPALVMLLSEVRADLFNWFD